MSNKSAYKESLLLPKTNFPMKASLPQMEPEVLKGWYEKDIYGQLRKARAGHKKFVLHDGPPYANGHLHMGTALNKVIKDFIMKSRSMAGFDVPYTPGWDCHGMPIEHQVMKNLGPKSREMDKLGIRRECRKYAAEYQQIQKEEFKRLGVLGDWENPYLTMSYQFESSIVGAIGDLAKEGYINRGLRPIHWCPSCRTALAEAELEYKDITSPAIYVRFSVSAGQEKLAEFTNLSVIIWTTTPWTIPSNEAICVNPALTYAVVRLADGQHWIMVKDLVESVMQVSGQEGWTIVKEMAGAELEGLLCDHPLYDRKSPVILGAHATAETGTGCVHTAPGHGADDYQVGIKYNLPVYSPVDDAGRFTADVAEYQGQKVFDTNDAVIARLEELGRLPAKGKITHAYPHCWRCKGPLIFRATPQWFLTVDYKDLRKRCLDEIEKTDWVTKWGHDRIHDMMEVRPDWCLSRQRAWGVPIPALHCCDCGEAILEEKLIREVEKKVAEKGADYWFEAPIEELVGDRVCPKCGHKNFRREENILDVWFDSSCSQRAVLENSQDLCWPSDLVFEGTDQHRGWFQVSLLTAVATRGKAPYKAVLTHGLILDEHAKKMSKSLGNVINPLDIIAKYGCDVLRLLFASVDYTKDVPFSIKMMDPLSESYRKIRNTIRFLLGNIADFNREKDAIAEDKLRPIDRWALARLQQVIKKVRAAYEGYQFHMAFRGILEYCVTDLSSQYLDILKDTLYADKADGYDRRSAQTVLEEIVRSLILLSAPLLAFTAEEAWGYLPKRSDDPDSVHLALFPEVREEPWMAETLAFFDKLMVIRDEVMRAIEEQRKAGVIGSSLEASLEIELGKEAFATCSQVKDSLELFFIVSECHIKEGALEDNGVKVTVSKATYEKCARCWNQRADVGHDANHPDVCGRCAKVLG